MLNSKTGRTYGIYYFYCARLVPHALKRGRTSTMPFSDITKTLLDQNSSTVELHRVLDQFAERCSKISNIEPDPSYSAWADDTFLSEGVAINPKAAAYCIKDYQRSVVFIRGVHAALLALFSRRNNNLAGKQNIDEYPNDSAHGKARAPVKVLYAGCGPFATLLLPLLHLFKPSDLEIHLIDIHQQSLDSVAHLLEQLGLSDYKITMVQADACTYQHPAPLDLIIVETMQKALEQEPQYAVTKNLAKQLAEHGLFIPEKITIELALAHLEKEKAFYKTHGKLDRQHLQDTGNRLSLGTLMQLTATSANKRSDHETNTEKTGTDSAKNVDSNVDSNGKNSNDQANELCLGTITIPGHEQLTTYQPLLFTRIVVYGEHTLQDYESSLTLPSRCVDLEPLVAGTCYRASYCFGAYPKINWLRL